MKEIGLFVFAISADYGCDTREIAGDFERVELVTQSSYNLFGKDSLTEKRLIANLDYRFESCSFP